MKFKNTSNKVLGVQTKDGLKTVLPNETIEVEEGNTAVAMLKEIGLGSISKSADKPKAVEPEPVAVPEPVVEEMTESDESEQIEAVTEEEPAVVTEEPEAVKPRRKRKKNQE